MRIIPALYPHDSWIDGKLETLDQLQLLNLFHKVYNDPHNTIELF